MSFHLTGWQDYENTYTYDLYHLNSRYTPQIHNNNSIKVNIHTDILSKNKLLSKCRYRLLVTTQQSNINKKTYEKRNHHILSLNSIGKKLCKKDLINMDEIEKINRNNKYNQYKKLCKDKKQIPQQPIQTKQPNIHQKPEHTFEKIDLKRLPSPSRYDILTKNDLSKQNNLKRQKTNPIFTCFKKKTIKQIKNIRQVEIKIRQWKNTNLQGQQYKEEGQFNNFRKKTRKSVSHFQYQAIKTLPENSQKNSYMFAY